MLFGVLKKKKEEELYMGWVCLYTAGALFNLN
jgi:hypothetical protein